MDWINFFNDNNIEKKNEDKWKFSGLNIQECETAIKNGWSEYKILNNYVKYRNFRKINVLEVDKSELDLSLDILEDILDKNRNTFKSLPANHEELKINNLNDKVLPRGAKKIDLLKAINEKRNTFRYKIDEPNNEFDNDGLDPNKYQKILKSINETKEIVFDKWKNKVTPEFLNKFLSSFLKRKGDENLKEKNLDKWLKGEEVEVSKDKLMGYTLQTEPIKIIKVAEIINGKFTGKINQEILNNGISGADVLIEEEKLSKTLAGAYLLPYVFNLIGFDPDKLVNDKYDPKDPDSSIYNIDNFAKTKKETKTTKGKAKDPKTGKIKEVSKTTETIIVDVDGPGVLPILTGGGKTTKLTRCLLTCIFPGKHIILITPNNELAADAANHHTSWLQYRNNVPYKCVIHGKEGKLPYSVKKDTLASWDNGNEIIGYQQKKERGKDIDDLTKPIYKKETSGKDGESTLSILQLHHLTRYIACGKTKINELVTTYFPVIAYQVIQPLLIRMGYKLLVMSATFPKKKFSISTSKPREVYSITEFKDQTDWANEKTQIFFKTTTDEYNLKPSGEEDLNAIRLKSGLDPKKFKMLEDSDIPFVIFDATNSSAVTGITEGMPPGSLFIANVNYEMGFSPDVDNVILTGETQLKRLGTDAQKWIYDTPDINFLSVASMVQQIGR
ncbi:9225_t:CDS:2, partial [Scutellospora calospora]